MASEAGGQFEQVPRPRFEHLNSVFQQREDIFCHTSRTNFVNLPIPPALMLIELDQALSMERLQKLADKERIALRPDEYQFRQWGGRLGRTAERFGDELVDVALP